MSCDELEFEKIYESFRPRIHRYLTRLVGEQEAEDLTQEVFMKISRALHTFRGDAQLSTWIYRIATNIATDKMRSPSFRQDAQTLSLDDSSQSENTDLCARIGSLSLEQKLMRKERYSCFRDFVENLPADYRTVVALSELGELPNNEIAEILGLSLDVVKIRLHRGRARLIQELKAQCKAEDWL